MTIGTFINGVIAPLGVRLVRKNPVAPAANHLKIELDPSKGTDDYDWSLYHLDYSAQIAGMSTEHTQKLAPGDFTLANSSLELKGGMLPLHPNHTVLYETIAALAPVSTIEVGCGGGDHLHNLGTLFPQMNVRGFDRSDDQLAFLKERSPHLSEKVAVLDATLPPSNRMPSAQVVYSQAVIMHIQAGNSHLVALSNMFRMAEQSVVLMENFKRHDFVSDILRLQAEGRIEWDDIHFYVRHFSGRPHILIASKQPLDGDGFEPMGSYQRLIDAMSWKPQSAVN